MSWEKGMRSFLANHYQGAKTLLEALDLERKRRHLRREQMKASKGERDVQAQLYPSRKRSHQGDGK